MKELVNTYPTETTCLALSFLVLIALVGMIWIFGRVTEIGRNEP